MAKRFGRIEKGPSVVSAVMLAVFVCSLAVLALSGCGGKEQEAEKAKPATQSPAESTAQAEAESAPSEPAFALRSEIPAAGEQGPPEEAASLTGNVAMGDTLFAGNCAICHGPRGTDKVSNPGSDDGTVPPLNPIDPELADKAPAVFAANIDRIIQHGSIPEGPDPRLFMPDWGDSKMLSQEDIADLEAYIMHLNGVNR
jgi:mono/diheme cytochrome c family protein